MPTTPTDQDDVLQDTSGNDNIDGLGGDDVITVTGGIDTIAGGSGFDTLVLDYPAFYAGIRTFTFEGTLATGYSGHFYHFGREVRFTGIERFDFRLGDTRLDVSIVAGGGDDRIITGEGSDNIAPGGGSDYVDSGDGGFGDRVDYYHYDHPNGVIKTQAGPVGIIINFSDAAHVVQSGHPLSGTVLMPNRAIDDFGFIDTLIGFRHAITSRNDDILLGSSGQNRFSSGAGADLLVGHAGEDVLFGGDGVDTVDYSREAGTFGIFVNLGASNVLVPPQYPQAGTEMPPNSGFDTYRDLDTLYGIENIKSGDLADFIYGDAVANRIETGGGDDWAFGLDGNDVLLGGAGHDFLLGDSGNDVLHGGAGDDFLITGADAASSDEAFGGLGTDTLAVAFIASASGVQNGLVASPDPDGGYTGHISDVGGSITVSFTSIETFNIIGSSWNDLITGAGGDDYIQGIAGNDVIHGVGGDDHLRGTGGDDALYGGVGRDVLEGEEGTDTTDGGPDDDIHIVDSIQDIAIEHGNEGTDTVLTSTSYALGANIENLRARDIGVSAPLRLTGNDLANIIEGTFGNNVLNGAGGADLMLGYGGHDLYYVDDQGDIPREDANGGVDTVATTVNYLLPANIENLQANDIAGSAPLQLTGNGLANAIWGTQGNNILNGAGGADFLAGYGGHDLYYVDHAGDVAYEDANGGTDLVVTRASYALGANIENLQADDIGGTSPLTLVGNELANFVWGTQGDNSLYGRGGNDRLYGYGGADRFVFDTAPGDADFDWLGDFQPGVDKIVLDNAVFAGLADGTLAAGAFHAGAAAADADDRIVHNSSNGAVFYDADGNGAGAALLIAIVPIGQILTAGDFTII